MFEFADLAAVHIYEDGYVRGLPREAQEALSSVSLRFDPHPERRWCEVRGPVADLRAELQMLGCRYTTHPGTPKAYVAPPLPMLTPDEAKAMTTEMTAMFGYIDRGLTRLTHVCAEFVKRKGWIAMGYDSLNEYSADCLPFKLPQQARRELVLQLVAEGISNRAAAAMARTTETTVRRDLTATNVAVARDAGGQAVDPVIGRDGRETRPRNTYTPVRQPDAVWTQDPGESPPDNVVQMPMQDSRIEAALSAFRDDNITATATRVHLLRGACDRWLLDHEGRNDSGVR